MRTSITTTFIILLLASCTTPPVVGPISQIDDPLAGKLTLADKKTYWIRPGALTYTGAAEYSYPNGSKYSGNFLNGKKHGNGRETLPSDEIYEGNWHNDRRDGQGVLIITDNSVYTGAFRNNQRTGFGIQTSLGGRYEGDWYADAPQGFGYFTGVEGIEYLGAWENGRRSGYGVGITRSKSHYEGMWAENKRNGYGEEIRIDGSSYKGDWIDNQRNGQGLARLPNGSSHEGTWEFNAPLGAGTSTDESGIELRGMWSGNTLRAGLVQLPGKANYAGLLYNARQRSLNPRFLDWISSEAKAGDAHAQLMLGKAYSDYNIPKQDLNKAESWFVLAANQGLIEAKYRLAQLYLQTRKNRNLAFELLSEAVKHKHALSALKLADLYKSGMGVVQDTAIAMQFYEQASAGGNMQARHKLAWLLATSSIKQFRDGARAVELAKPMAYIFDSWPYLETLAAALAESGNYGNAVVIQQKALKRAESVADTEIQAQLIYRLELYKTAQPFRSD